MKYNHIKYIGLSVFYLFLTSCEYNVEEENIEESTCDPDLSFSVSIKPVIDNNCIQCHNGSVHPLDFSDFAVVRANAERVRALTQARVMPPQGPLTSEEIALIGCWVDNGTPDN